MDQPDVATLTPESTDEDIMQHMLWVTDNQTTSTELTRHFPDLDRARAYNIQRLRLEHREQTEARVGWKIGWSNVDFTSSLSAACSAPPQAVMQSAKITAPAVFSQDGKVFIAFSLIAPSITQSLEDWRNQVPRIPHGLLNPELRRKTPTSMVTESSTRGSEIQNRQARLPR